MTYTVLMWPFLLAASSGNACRLCACGCYPGRTAAVQCNAPTSAMRLCYSIQPDSLTRTDSSSTHCHINS